MTAPQGSLCSICLKRSDEGGSHPSRLKKLKKAGFWDHDECASQIGGDDLTNPQHYTRFSIEPIDAIESWGLNFRLANVVKYVARADHKGQRERDLRKAMWYLQRELDA